MSANSAQYMQSAEIPHVNGMDFGSLTQTQTQNQEFLQSVLYRQVYPTILQNVALTMIDLMAKPKEVLLTINDDGEVEEEHIEDTENLFLYERMRETLVYLTNLNPQQMDKIIQDRLEKITTDR